MSNATGRLRSRWRWAAPIASIEGGARTRNPDMRSVLRSQETARPLAWRIFLVNAAVFALGAAALALSPATVSWPIALAEAVVLTAGLTATLLVNLVLVRRSLAPLERLAALMRHIDLLRPGQRLTVTGPAEVRGPG